MNNLNTDINLFNQINKKLSALSLSVAKNIKPYIKIPFGVSKNDLKISNLKIQNQKRMA